VAANPESILDSVKHVLGFDPEYTAFDIDVLLLINSAFGSLQQLGVGSDTGFVITDNTTLWAQYVSSLGYLGMVKTYIFMAVKLAFDPPATSFGIEALNSQLEQLAFRINIAAESEHPPADPFATEEILELAGEGATVFEGGVMPTFFAPKVEVLDYAAVVTPDAKDGNVFYLTLAGPCTVNAPVNAVNGEHVTIGLTPAGFTLTWGNGWNFGEAGLPTPSSDKTDILSAVYRESTNEWLAGYTPGF
jgi:hypothetical protein